MAILERAAWAENQLTPAELLQEVRQLGLRTPSEAATDLRHDRESR
jgi:hypothetical protein